MESLGGVVTRYITITITITHYNTVVNVINCVINTSDFVAVELFSAVDEGAPLSVTPVRV